MILVVQVNGGEETHDVQKVIMDLDRNIIRFEYKGEVAEAREYELSAIGFPDFSLTLLVGPQDA